MTNLAIVSELEVKYKRTCPVYPAIKSSNELHELLKPMFDEESYALEIFIVVFMNRFNRPLTWKVVSRGGVSGTVVDPKIIFGPALKIPTCTGLVMAHNHPSGMLKPSEEDIRITKRMNEGGKILELKILDHLILDTNGDKYFSFADEGLL